MQSMLSFCIGKSFGKTSGYHCNEHMQGTDLCTKNGTMKEMTFDIIPIFKMWCARFSKKKKKRNSDTQLCLQEASCFNYHQFKQPNRIKMLCINTSIGINRPKLKTVLNLFHLPKILLGELFTWHGRRLISIFRTGSWFEKRTRWHRISNEEEECTTDNLAFDLNSSIGNGFSRTEETLPV